LHGFGREVWRSKSSEAHVTHLKAPPALRILVGGETLELERTTLSNLVKRFGGSVHSWGDAGDSIYWVCYNDAPTRRTLWFVSDEMGGSDKAVMALAPAADGGGDHDGCARPAAPIANVTINIPTLGGSGYGHRSCVWREVRSSVIGFSRWLGTGGEQELDAPDLDPVQARPRQDYRRRGAPIDGELSLSYLFRGPLHERLNDLAAGHRPCSRRSG
jgi:hypothetical protein